MLDSLNGNDAKIKLLDTVTKNPITDYSIKSNSESRLDIVRSTDGTLYVGLAKGVEVRNGTKLTAKLTVTNQAKTYSKPITVTVSVTVYTKEPTVKTKAPALALNLMAEGDVYSDSSEPSARSFRTTLTENENHLHGDCTIA